MLFNTPSPLLTKQGIFIRGEQVEEVNSFKYLGSTLNSKKGGEEEKGGLWLEIYNRIFNASRIFGALRKKVFKNKHLSLNIKTYIYKVTIIPILTYASATWPITQLQLKKLEVFHMKCLRSIANISILNKITNTNILNITHNKSITDIIERDRWLFFGRVMERDASTWCTKSIMSGRVKGGRRKQGRSDMRWSDLIAKQGRGEMERGGVMEYYEHEWLIYHDLAIKTYNKRKDKKGGGILPI
jgi:hypothetical protein